MMSMEYFTEIVLCIQMGDIRGVLAIHCLTPLRWLINENYKIMIEARSMSKVL